MRLSDKGYMIAFDTNALVRLLTEDDEKQAEIVQAVVKDSERKDILILTEVLIQGCQF